MENVNDKHVYPETAYRDVSYSIVEPARLSAGQREDIHSLIGSSLAVDYPEDLITDDERSYLQDQIAGTLGKIGGRVESPLLNRRQRFGRALSILAINHDELIAHLTVADNVSSNYSGPKGELEMWAKMNVPEIGKHRFIKHRYGWLGYAAMSPQVHETIIDEPDHLNPLDVMMVLASDTRDKRQPMTAYPYAEETAWRKQLEKSGFRPQAGQDSDVPAYGPGNEPVHQQRWLIKSIPYVEFSLSHKSDFVEALWAARTSLGNS